jgi:excisionase family DNA binding protein
LGVARVTVIKWIKTGKITAYNVHGRWRIPYSEVERLLGDAAKRRLERQAESLKIWAVRNFPGTEYAVVADIASGLKEDRKGLGKLIEMAKRREVDAVIVAYRDRLTRFGFEYLRELFRAHGVELYVAFQEEPKDYVQELVEDFVELATSFAARIHGSRSGKYEKISSCIKRAVEDSD